MTEPCGPVDGFDLDELTGYLEVLQAGVDAHVTEPRLLRLRTQALNTIDPALDHPVTRGSGTDIDRPARSFQATEVTPARGDRCTPTVSEMEPA